MSIQQKDYLQRLIEQLADALAVLMKKRRAKEHVQVLALVGDACRELLGMEYAVLTAVDARSAAELLGHPMRVRALAQLVMEEAYGLGGLGQEERAEGKLFFASQLEAEAKRMEHG